MIFSRGDFCLFSQSETYTGALMNSLFMESLQMDIYLRIQTMHLVNNIILQQKLKDAFISSYREEASS